jgi:hypothetical protein
LEIWIILWLSFFARVVVGFAIPESLVEGTAILCSAFGVASAWRGVLSVSYDLVPSIDN